MGDTSLTCEKFLSQLPTYFEGDFDTVIEARMDRHRATCTPCKTAHVTMQADRLAKYGRLGMFTSPDPLAIDCFTEATLAEYRQGTLSGEEAALVGDHIGECFSCAIQVENMTPTN